MTTLRELIKRGLDTPVDFSFIKRCAGTGVSIRMVDHETSLSNKPSLKDVFKGHQVAAILLHVKQGKTRIGHWILAINKRGQNKISLFDSLGLGLKGLYRVTHESPKLLYAFEGHKWEDSTVQLQRFGSHYRECGSFCGVRAVFFKLTNREFVKLIKSWDSQHPDKTAVMLVLLHFIEDKAIDIQSKKFKRLK